MSDQAEYDKDVSPYRLYYWKVGDAAASELASGATRGMPQGLVVSDQFDAAFLERRSAAVSSGPRRRRAPPAAEGAPPPTSRRHLELARSDCCSRCSGCARHRSGTASFRAVVHLADKRFVQLATPEFPTVNPGDDANRAIGTSDLPYQQEMSWDASYSDVALVDLKTGQRQQVLEHWRVDAHDVVGREVSDLFR